MLLLVAASAACLAVSVDAATEIGARREVIVASQLATALYRMEPDGSGLSLLSRGQDPRDSSPPFSPSGAEVVFVRESTNGAALYTMKLKTRVTTLLVKVDAWRAAWSPDGRRIAFNPITGGITLVDLPGRAMKQLTARSDNHPTWSPDSKQIAFARDATGNGDQTIWLIGVNGKGLRQLTQQALGPDGGRTRDIYPAWSPDGRLIAFERESDINIVELATGRTRRLVERASSPTWAPDGSKLLFVAFRREGPGLFTINRHGGKERLLRRGVWSQTSWGYLR